jgi:hypothetical protein
MNTFKRLPALVVMVSAVALSLAAIAIADTITGDANSITANIDGSVEVAAGSSGAGKFALVVNDNATDTRNGCNANATNPVLLAVSSSQSWLTLTQSTITVNDCDSGTTADGLQNAAAVNFSVASGAPAGATATVTATYQSGGRGGTYAPGSFQVKTPAAPADSTAPTSSASAKNANNSAYTFGGWTNQNVSVTLSGSDNSGGSGLKEIRYTTNGVDPTASTGTVYNGPFTITTEGTTTVKWRAIDNLGNLESVHSEAVKIDKTAPAVNCGSADGTWHPADVSIGCTATDGGSGVTPATDETFSLHTNVAAGTENSNASTGTRTVSDAAGNTATAGPVGGNKVDKKAPGVSCD